MIEPSDEEGLTTDYSDIEDMLLYRKYKHLKSTNKESMKDIHEKI